jgi:hypothetical protein
MHHEAHPTALLHRQGLRPRAEIRGRTLLPFHQTPHGATHDLLVMNHRPDLAPAAEDREHEPAPNWRRTWP